MNICLLADAQSIHIQQLTCHLARRGHHLHVITHKPAMLPSATVERYAVPPAGLMNLRSWSGRRRRYLKSLLRRFDIVNIHFLADWGLAAVLTDRDAKDARVVASAWGSDIVPPPGEDPPAAELTEERKALLRTSDAVTTCGPSFAATVATYAAIPQSGIHVVPFGVDRSLFQPQAQPPKSETGARIGFLKGFRTVYGPRVLIRAIPRVLEEVPEARFELIGAGKELESCRALVSRLGIDYAVSWEGPVPHCEIPQRLQRWHLSVIPSIHEAFGVAALESQAMEVPVVASKVCGLLDTVRVGETGLHFPVGKPVAMAEGIIRLITEPKERAKMGAAGREMVASRFDWVEVACCWEALYSGIREKACVMV